MGRLLLKPGVVMGDVLAPAGARILNAIKHLTPEYDFDVVITSGRDGQHSGPADPHYSGEAFDLRTNTLMPHQKSQLLTDLRRLLYSSTPRRFYAFLENPGGANEHLHVQRRAGTTYSMMDFLEDV